MTEFATEARESFNVKFTTKIGFKNHPFFYDSITDSDIGSLKFLPTLFGKYLDHILVKFEQNRITRNIQNFETFGQKWLIIFEKVLTPF